MTQQNNMKNQTGKTNGHFSLNWLVQQWLLKVWSNIKSPKQIKCNFLEIWKINQAQAKLKQSFTIT